MNKINWNYYFRYFRKIVLAFLIASIVTGIFVTALYFIVPKDSWITLRGKPQKLKLTNITDEYFEGETRDLIIDGAFSTPVFLKVPTRITISNYGGEIVYCENIPENSTIYLDFDLDEQQSWNGWEDYDCFAMSFSAPVGIRRGAMNSGLEEISFEESDIRSWEYKDNADWELNLQYRLYLFGDNSPNAKELLYKENWFNQDDTEQFSPVELMDIDLDNEIDAVVAAEYISFMNNEVFDADDFYSTNYYDESLFFELVIPEGTELQLAAPFNILIPDSEGIIGCYSCFITIEFQEEYNYFLLPCNEASISISDSDLYYGTFALDGKCESFEEVSSAADDSLIYTYLSEQKEYSVDNVQINGRYGKGTPLDFSCSFTDAGSDVRIAGASSFVAVANTPLGYSAKQFIVDNLSSIIIGFFTTIIGAYLTLIQDNFPKETCDASASQDISNE